MSSIYFHFYFTLVISIIFSIIGLVLLLKKKEPLGRILGILFLLIGLVKMTQFLISEPSLTERKTYYSELEALRIEKIREVEIIDLSSKKKVAIKKEDIPILLSTLSNCEPSIFELRQRKYLEHFKVVFQKNDGKELIVSLTETDNGVSLKNLIYKVDSEEFNIGRYRCNNPNIVSKVLGKRAL